VYFFFILRIGHLVYYYALKLIKLSIVIIITDYILGLFHLYGQKLICLPIG